MRIGALTVLELEDEVSTILREKKHIHMLYTYTFTRASPD